MNNQYARWCLKILHLFPYVTESITLHSFLRVLCDDGDGSEKVVIVLARLVACRSWMYMRALFRLCSDLCWDWFNFSTNWLCARLLLAGKKRCSFFLPLPFIVLPHPPPRRPPLKAVVAVVVVAFNIHHLLFLHAAHYQLRWSDFAYSSFSLPYYCFCHSVYC